MAPHSPEPGNGAFPTRRLPTSRRKPGNEIVFQIYRTWGERIRSRRLELGLSQFEVAERIHMTQNALSRWESAIAAPTDKDKLALALALETEVVDLFPWPTRDEVRTAGVA
jgi:ribosome-binding protein aMBF1 (putative translation factor)